MNISFIHTIINYRLIEHDFNPVGQMFRYAQEYQRNLIELKETLIQSEDHIRDTLSDCSQVRLFVKIRKFSLTKISQLALYNLCIMVSIIIINSHTWKLFLLL